MTAPDPVARTALLRRLGRDGSLPPEATIPWAADAHAAAFTAEVEAFAAAFWSLPPGDRRDRWHDLTARGFGPATARLAELAPGLDVAPGPQPAPRAAELGAFVQGLFVLAPAARAARRLAWLRAAGRRDPEWVAAVRAVLRTDPDLARLEPRLFDWYSRNQIPAPVPGVPGGVGWVEGLGGVNFNPAPTATAPTVTEPNPVLGCISGWSVVVIAALAFLRLACSGGRPPSTVDPFPYQPPAYYRRTPAPPDPAAPWERPITLTEIAGYVEYERAVAEGAVKSGTAPPGRYTRWVELGRPTRAVMP